MICIAAFGFYACYQQYQMLREMGPEQWQDGPDLSAAFEVSPHPARRRHVSKRAIRRAKRLAEEEAQEAARVDAILAKVSAHGMNSLTWGERRTLHKATAHRRQREGEDSLVETHRGKIE